MTLDIQKLATEADDGTYFVRTRGLDAHRHPELEIVGIPRAAVEPAAKLIDYVIETVVEHEGVKLKADENVGVPLSMAGHEDEFPAIFVGVHATESEPPTGGLFARMRGAGSKGVLRLVDLPGSDLGPPVAALASTMLYRANCRVVMGDHDGAVAELRAGIEMTPGDPSAGPPPEFDTHDSELNWQNHVSYLRLAELVEPDEATAIYKAVFSRFDWLARRDLGCMPEELGAVAEAGLAEQALNIIQQNVAQPEIAPGPHSGLRLVASPLWSATGDGTSVRETTLLPAAFVDYYFGGRLADADTAKQLARLASACVVRYAREPWKVSFMTAGARDMYEGGSAFSVREIGPSRPAWFLLSAVIAEAARYLHAGASFDELQAAFGVSGAAPAIPDSLASRMTALEDWEHEQYTQAIGGPLQGD